VCFRALDTEDRGSWPATEGLETHREASLETPSEVKWLGIKPYLFRIFSGFMVLWSGNQVVYMVMAWTTPIPTAAVDTLLLVYPAQETSYLTSLVYYCLAVVVFGIGTVIPSRTLMRVEEWWEVHRERPTWIAGIFLYVGFALAILLYFWVSITAPKYQTYIDPDAGSIIRRHTHLLRPGVIQETIPLADIKEIIFDFGPTAGGRDSYINLVIGEGREIEVGRVTGSYTEEDLVELGKQISQYSSVPFEEPSLPILY
jgi:hypothetical protein